MRSPKIDQFVSRIAWILFIGFVGYTVAWLLAGLFNIRFFVDWVWDRTRDFLGWFLDVIPETPESHYREGSLTWWIDHFPISSTLTLVSTSFWKVWLVWFVVALVVAIALVVLWLVLSLLAKAFSGLGFGGAGGGGHATAPATGGVAGGGEVHHHYAPSNGMTVLIKPMKYLAAMFVILVLTGTFWYLGMQALDKVDERNEVQQVQDDVRGAQPLCGDVDFNDIDAHAARGCWGVWLNAKNDPNTYPSTSLLHNRLGKYCAEVGVTGSPDEQSLALEMAVSGISCPPSVMVKAQKWVNDTAASTPGVNVKDAAEGKIGSEFGSISFPSDASISSRLGENRTIIILVISVIAGIIVNRYVRHGHWIPDTRVAWGTLPLCIVGIYVAISFLL